MIEMDKPSRFTGAAPDNLAVGYVRSSTEPAKPSLEKQSYLVREYAACRGLRLTAVIKEGVR